MKICFKQKGFTLIELLVVVGLIGALSSIAIPNFKKYRNKSRQAEAKINLASIYVAQLSYFAEYDNYIMCLRQIGFVPNSNRRYYSIGFGGGKLGSAIFNYAGTIPCNNTTLTHGMALTASDVIYSATHAGKGATYPQNTDFSDAIIPVDQLSYIAKAVGNLNGAPLDSWTIDHNKNLINTVSGL